MKKRRRSNRFEYERRLEQEAFDREQERERLNIARLIAEADHKDRIPRETTVRHHIRRRKF